eukprot:scaffold1.g5653.t1
MSGLFKKPTPREQLRESQRSIGHNVRDLERELAVLKREEAKLVKEIKDAAAKGNVAGAPQPRAKILAKNLVRIRNQQTKLLSAMAGLRGVSVSMQTAVATGTVAQSLGQAGQAMAAVGQTQDLKAVQKTAMQFAKESETMEMKGEMMDGALESAMGDDVEEEMDEVMERVMDEIGACKAPLRRSIKVDALAVGDKLPTDLKFNYFDAEGNMQEVTVGSLTKGKKVVLFAVPGAFTPTCSLKHLPGFIEKADELRAKGVDTIGCVAVNDAFVMDAWGKSVGAEGKVLMLADGSALFAKAIGAELDLTDKGLGLRSRRYAMLVDDGVVKTLNLEEGGAFTVSSAEDILANL